MDLNLSNRVVAITGASSGIGQAAALACAAAGASVALAARRLDRIETLAQKIISDGGCAAAIATDVGEEEQARHFVQEAHRQLGRLDALINNAGLMLLGPIEGAPTEEWRRMIQVNVLGLLYCTHAALPIMRQQGSGHIVNISSVAGRVARAGVGVYNLTKFGVGAFSEALRQETVNTGIRVTVIEPGMVATELAGHNRPEVLAQVRASRGSGPALTPLAADDIARAIVFALAQPANVSFNEILVRPSAQP